MPGARTKADSARRLNGQRASARWRLAETGNRPSHSLVHTLTESRGRHELTDAAAGIIIIAALFPLLRRSLCEGRMQDGCRHKAARMKALRNGRLVLRLGMVVAVLAGSMAAWPVGASGPASAQAGLRQLNRTEYADRLRAMWLGETIANWTGLTTEGVRTDAPFYTDADWGLDQGIDWKPNDVIDFVLQDPWLADDDTDIEYVYLHLLARHDTNLLTASQIAEGWKQHINDWIWVSNRQARDLMERGALPPVTGMRSANPESLQIDAQLTTEVFGALAPGMPGQALRLANLPILTTAAGYAAHAAQYHVLLYSLAASVDRTLPARDQIVWLVSTAREYLPDTSKTAEVIDFVLADYLSNPDRNDWERTRDRIYERFQQRAGDYGYVYRGWTESSVNLATGTMALLYGEGDFRRTVQIGTLSGWDSDNGTATMGGLLGLLLGYDALLAQFPGVTLSDRYQIARTRDNLPDYLPEDGQAEDTFTLMAERMLPIVEQTILDGGGSVDGGTWYLPPDHAGSPLVLNPLEQITQQSANNRVRLQGGEVETWVEDEPSQAMARVIADGVEHDFTGIEPRRPLRSYKATARDGSVMLAVVYDRPVEAAVVRFIEGDPGVFTAFDLELLAGDEWVPAPAGTTLSGAPDTRLPYQVFDFALPERMEIMGARLTGAVEAGPLGDVMILELDVLAGQ